MCENNISNINCMNAIEIKIDGMSTILSCVRRLRAFFINLLIFSIISKFNNNNKLLSRNICSAVHSNMNRETDI